MQTSVCLLIVLISLIMTSYLGCTNSEFSLRHSHPARQVNTEVRSPNELQDQVREGSFHLHITVQPVPISTTHLHISSSSLDKAHKKFILRPYRQKTVAWMISACLACRTLWIRSPAPNKLGLVNHACNPSILGKDRKIWNSYLLGYIEGFKTSSLYMRPCLKTWKRELHEKLIFKIKLIWNCPMPLYVFCRKILLDTFSVYHPWRQLMMLAFCTRSSFGFWAYFLFNLFSGK